MAHKFHPTSALTRPVKSITVTSTAEVMKPKRSAIHKMFRRGGKELIDLLDYCVRSIQMDPVFSFLAYEYRDFPTVPKAVALYEIFCAPQAPARISLDDLLPPRDLRLRAALQPLQLHWNRFQAAQRDPAQPRPPVFLPPKFLFDATLVELELRTANFRKIRRRYNPQLSPIANLPGGKMSAGQRAFVEKVWEPRLRPWLAGAGFRRIATIA
jgi:hypothetical protein